jgi:Uridine kinase
MSPTSTGTSSDASSLVNGVNNIKLSDRSKTDADILSEKAHYAPPWADVSIIGIAGSSGSGKSTLSQAIVNKLNLPWVVILSIVSPRQGR